MEIREQLRQSGKTHDIATEMKNNPKSFCVQPSLVQADFFLQKYGFKKNRVITFQAYIKNCRNNDLFPRDWICYIDEMGCCVEMLCPHNIGYATNTNY